MTAAAPINPAEHDQFGECLRRYGDDDPFDGAEPTQFGQEGRIGQPPAGRRGSRLLACRKRARFPGAISELRGRQSAGSDLLLGPASSRGVEGGAARRGAEISPRAVAATPYQFSPAPAAETGVVGSGYRHGFFIRARQLITEPVAHSPVGRIYEERLDRPPRLSASAPDRGCYACAAGCRAPRWASGS
jgi:hypothetical protein